jgi:tetratricopeptide (TPR) repeat protein
VFLGVSEKRKTIGPYRLLEPLGRGTMGVVYSAEHLHTAQRVALKTVAVPNEGLLASLRREVHALTRLRHPGIARVLDEGVEDGLPWYAMELIEGETLREHCHKRLGLRELLTVTRRLCAPLAYLHGEGLVHRDLKPTNVIVRAGSIPVLVDFGLASRFAAGLSREALESGGQAIGTVAYMAPEQGRGKFVDARADLYALGCILYELLTGQPPFVGEAPVQVLWQHFESEPRAPSQLVGGLPPELDALVLRLLAKDPRERYGYADDVAAALARLGAENGIATAPRPRAYLYRPRFAGHEETLRQIEQHLSRLRGGRGSCLFVGGESGIGKTRLAMEVSRLTERHRVRVLLGECLSAGAPADGGPAREGSPLQPLRRSLQAIADRCRERGLEETERLLAERGKLLALYEPSLRELPGQSGYPEPADLPAEAARLRVYTALADTFAVLAADQPLLLILDDLHWADELTLGFVQFLLRSKRIEQMPLLLVGTYRSEEIDDGLRAVLGSGTSSTFELKRFEEPAVGSMVGDMLAMTPAPLLFVRFLARQSEGNPFFVAEYLRTAVAEGLLYRDLEGRWQVLLESEATVTEATYEQLPLPGSLRELVSRRLEGLDAARRSLTQTASVLGREMPAALLARVAGVDPDLLLEGLDELLRRQVLEELDGGSRLRFVHDKIREVAYEQIALARRRNLHRQAAEAMEAVSTDVSAPDAAALGLHWEKAGEMAKAQGWYLVGAREAARRFAHGEAERLYRAILGLADLPPSERIRVGYELAREILEVQGRIPEAMELGRQGLAAARRLGDRTMVGRLLAEIASLHFFEARFEEAQEHFEKALAAQREAGDRLYEAKTLNNFAILRQSQGRLAEAQALYEQALAAHREAGNRPDEAGTLSALGTVLWDRGRPAEAEERYQQALPLFQEAGDSHGIGIILGQLALIRAQQGLPREAEKLFEQAIRIQRQVGNRRSESIAILNLARFHLLEGSVETSRRLYEQALAIARDIGDRDTEFMTRSALAAIQRQIDGDFAAAEQILQGAEALATEAGAPLTLAFCRCERGHISLALGDSGRGWLALALEIVSGRAEPTSELGLTVSTLQRAVEAFEAGRPLFRGELVDDLTDGLRRWLIETGQLVLEQR